MENSISVIVPVYNFSQRFNDNLALLKRELQELGADYEIIVVDDGSRERKYQPNFEHLSAAIKFKSYGKNMGKGYALKYGFNFAGGKLIVFIDADLELNPSDIKNFVRLMEIYQADIVIGSKRHPYSEVNYPWYRKILSWGYQIFIRLFLNVKGVRDSQVGLKLFQREVLEKVLPRVLVKQYAFDLELLAVASHLGYDKILEAPIRLDYQHNFKTSSWSDFRRLIKMIWYLLIDTLAIVYRMRVVKYYDASSKIQGYKIQTNIKSQAQNSKKDSKLHF